MTHNRNVEIKAKLSDFDEQFRLSQELCGTWALIRQRDVFFHCDRGRLKLRVFSDRRGELIFYQRADQRGPKTSNYSITPTDTPERLEESLGSAYGVRAVVSKMRRLFLHGRTRIHLDQVDRLGDFLELEVVLAPGDSETDGEKEAARLMRKLKINQNTLITNAYVDLLEKTGAQTNR